MRKLALLSLIVLLTSCSQWNDLQSEFEGLGQSSSASSSTSTSSNKPPISLPKAQDSITSYLQDNRYHDRVDRVAKAIKKYIGQRSGSSTSKHVAIVLDVDETALSNLDWIKTNLLQSPLAKGVGTQSFIEWQKTGKCTAIFPILSVYQHAQDNGIEIFFISERPESMREITELNLIKQGYGQHHNLILRPDDSQISVMHFKTEERRKIEQQGFEILVNIGDQDNDFEGGYSGRNYRVPNPFYKSP